MKKFSAKEIVIPTVVLLVICLVTSGLLAFTNQLTKQKIADIATENEIATRKVVLPEADAFSALSDVPGLEDATFCIGNAADGSVAGYVFTTITKGYGGNVKIMTGVSADGKVTGVKTLELNETAGLGMNAQNDSFLSQFVGKIAGIKVVKNGAAENEIVALTGATITSTAVTKAVNNALDGYKTIKNGGVGIG